MRKIRLTISIAIIVAIFGAFFYNTFWFWFSNPELTQMQILIQKWPWMVLVIVTSILAIWILSERREFGFAVRIRAFVMTLLFYFLPTNWYLRLNGCNPDQVGRRMAKVAKDALEKTKE